MLNIAHSEYAVDSRILISAVAILILLNLIFFPAERIYIESKDGDYLIKKAPRFGNNNLGQLEINKKAFKDFEIVKSGFSLGDRLVIHYTENSQSKKIDIGLKNFSNQNRQTLLKQIDSKI